MQRPTTFQVLCLISILCTFLFVRIAISARYLDLLGYVDIGELDTHIVDLGYAKYRGNVLRDAGVREYLGMRYAAPPLGDRRWRAPQDPLPEEGISDATRFKPSCAGLGRELGKGLKEDCLYLSVHAPSTANRTSKLPVWFFIQGGGYSRNAAPTINGTMVVQNSGHNIVFVQLNYRVGVFGFLASERIRMNGDLNVGLLDQQAALEWVQKYIHLFGGDPNHVVIHGDSAGAGSVTLHLTAYGGKGKELGIVGGMIESPFVPTHRTVAQSESQFDIFANSVNCSKSDTKHQLACLRSKRSVVLQEQNVVSAFPEGPKRPLPAYYWLPVIDGTFCQDYLSTQLEKGEFKRVPVLLGNDNDEGTFFAPNATSTQAEFLDFVKANFPLLTEENLRDIAKLYPENVVPPFPFHPYAWYPAAELAYGESTFTCPGISISKAFAQHVSPQKSWNYHYNVTGDETDLGMGVQHVAEKVPIFGVGNIRGCRPLDQCSYALYNAPMVPIVQNYWISFVRTLNPNTFKDDTAPIWEPLGSNKNARLKFQLHDMEMETIPEQQQARCDLWKSLAAQTEQ